MYVKMKNTWKKAPGGFLALLLICTLMLSGCGGEEGTELQATAPSSETEGSEEVQPAENSAPENVSPAPGTLLESGSGLNENYYANVSYFGIASDVTDSSFVLGKDAMAFHGSEPVLGQVVIHYSENTAVKTAVLRGDTYEIYAASLDDLKKYGGEIDYTFDVVLDDREANELWAAEIRIARFASE